MLLGRDAVSIQAELLSVALIMMKIKLKMENIHCFYGLGPFHISNILCHLKIEKCFFMYTHFCLSVPSKIKGFDTLNKHLNSVELD